MVDLEPISVDTEKDDSTIYGVLLIISSQFLFQEHHVGN